MQVPDDRGGSRISENGGHNPQEWGSQTCFLAILPHFLMILANFWPKQGEGEGGTCTLCISITRACPNWTNAPCKVNYRKSVCLKISLHVTSLVYDKFKHNIQNGSWQDLSWQTKVYAVWIACGKFNQDHKYSSRYYFLYRPIGMLGHLYFTYRKANRTDRHVTPV